MDINVGCGALVELHFHEPPCEKVNGSERSSAWKVNELDGCQ